MFRFKTQDAHDSKNFHHFRDAAVLAATFNYFRDNAKIGPDYHFEIEGHRYSVPYTPVGKRIEARFSQWTVEAYHSSKRRTLVNTLSRRGFTTDPSHRPEKHAHPGGY